MNVQSAAYQFDRAAAVLVGARDPQAQVTITSLLPDLAQELDILEKSIDGLRSAAAPVLQPASVGADSSGGLPPSGAHPPAVEALQSFIRRVRNLRHDLDDIGERLAL